MSKYWIQIGGLKDFDLLEVKHDLIRAEDIAKSLAAQPRYYGHFGHYSVAQHSVLVSVRMEELLGHCAHEQVLRASLCGLLHDASEAYLGDVSAPLKRAMRALSAGRDSPYDVLEKNVQSYVYERFGIDPRPFEQIVRRADLELLATEKRDLLGAREGERSWGLTHEALPFKIHPWPAESAVDRFLARFEWLTGSLETNE